MLVSWGRPLYNVHKQGLKQQGGTPLSPEARTVVRVWAGPTHSVPPRLQLLEASAAPGLRPRLSRMSRARDISDLVTLAPPRPSPASP